MSSVFTIHNMGYQGRFPPDTLPLLTLPWDLFTIAKMEFFGQVNFLKGALAYSDFVTTVSKRYARRSKPPNTVSAWKAYSTTVPALSPESEGVDYKEWSPQTDKFTAPNYSPPDLGERPSANTICSRPSAWPTPMPRCP